MIENMISKHKMKIKIGYGILSEYLKLQTQDIA